MIKIKFCFCLTVALVLFLFGAGLKIANAEENKKEEQELIEQAEKEQKEIEKNMMDQIDLTEIENSLHQMFPEEKMSFEDVLSVFMSGNIQEMGSTVIRFLSDQLSYEFRYSRHNLVYILLIALLASVLSNFADAFRSRQISDIGFYVLYMLLIVFCLSSFQKSLDNLEVQLERLTEFMRVLCPGYFLAVAFASGSVTSLFFYNVILVLIYAVETVIAHFLLPVIHIYIMILILGNLVEEDYLSELASLVKKLISWSLKTMLAFVVGINVIQGLLAPAIDSLKRSTVTRTAEAIPLIGDAIGGGAEVVLGTAVLIKNGIGMAGACIAILICAVPVLQMLFTALMYKAAAAFVQPVSDKRLTACISGISEGYELLVKVLLTSAVLFLLTIAVVAASTS